MFCVPTGGLENCALPPVFFLPVDFCCGEGLKGRVCLRLYLPPL